MIRFKLTIPKARVAAILCWSALAVACSGDDNHGPTIGAPTTTVPINEGGSSTGIGGGFSTGGASAGGATSIGGSISTGGTFGATGVAGTFTSGGTDPFGTGGTGTGTPFGASGTTSSAAGTAPF
jgi:hypothetical protein